MKVPDCLKGLCGKKNDSDRSSVAPFTSIVTIPRRKEPSSFPRKPPKDELIPGALTPHFLCEIDGDEFPDFRLDMEKLDKTKLGPRPADLIVGDKLFGILVSGPKFVPQFIPFKLYRKDRHGDPIDYIVYDKGLLVKDTLNHVRFYPESLYTYDEGGQPVIMNRSLFDSIDNYCVGLKVLQIWQEEKKREAELKKKAPRKPSTCCIIIAVVLCVLLVACVIGISVYLYIHLSPTPDSSDTSVSSAIFLQNTTNVPLESASIETMTGTGRAMRENSTTTTPPTTTTTKAYPVMTSTQRLPIVDLLEPTFQIVSAAFRLKVGVTQSILVYRSCRVVYRLSITKPTEKIKLHCTVHSIDDILLNGVQTESYNYDKKTRLLTVNLPEPINGSNLNLQVSFIPSDEAFERIDFPCRSDKCYVLVNQKLSLLVPHFDYWTEHKWTINVEHPAEFQVVTNSKSINTSSPTSSKFLETASLLPSELSIVLTENFEKHASSQQIGSCLSSQTMVEDVTQLVKTFDKALASKLKPSAPSGELFFIVVVPAMDNYLFFGRNVALVGTKLLMANQEIQNEFVWKFIFRTVIYNKVSSNDKNPTWIYEQSAFFLSTMVKSNNKNMWKKHLYGSAMDSGYRDIKGLSDQSMTYEDEHRYLDKYEHIAKVSTVLAMVTSLGSSVSGDPLTILDDVRDNSTSDLFFFVNKQLKLQNGQMLNVDVMTTCYVDSPVTPRVHISRVDPSHVLVQRTDRGEQSCDMYLCYVRDKNNKQTTTKEYMVLSSKEQKVTVEAKSAILLSGNSPFSAYGYTMEQREFDRLVHEDVLASFDDSSLNMLASNAFRAAFEGKLSYESLHSFMRMVVSRKVVSVDEAVDLWMWTVRKSRNESLRGLTEAIVSSVINATGDVSNSSTVEAYVCGRIDKSVKQASRFEIDKALYLYKTYSKPCSHLNISSPGNYMLHNCFLGTANCSYDPLLLEYYASMKVSVGGYVYYNYFASVYEKCVGKPCHMPILRGLMCSRETSNLTSWLSKSLTLDTDLISRQVVLGIFNGLATNSLSRHMLFPFLIDNWHVIHKKYITFPAFLGEIIDTLASTIYTWEQLEEFKQFVTYHGQNLIMYREFQEQIFKAEKAVEWNKKYSDDFSRLFE